MSQSTGIRRGRFRFLYQFSLRSLLVAMAASAIFCNWYFQPKYHEDELAGKDLRVRQQRKLVRPKAVELPPAAYSGPPPQPQPIDHGHYTLLDGDDFVLARGQFVEGNEMGRWVTYYPTGHKAAEGKMHSGVKVGLWRTWYEDGTLASEVTFANKPVEGYDPFRLVNGPWVASGGVSGYSKRKILDPHIDCRSSREGPIKSWYQSGQLRYEGQNRADKQDGVWKYYDERGRLTASGPYRAGKRHGTWTIVGQASRLPSHSRTEWTTLTVVYIDGRTRDQLDRLLARLEKQFASPQPYRHTQALIDLAEVGEGAVPLLQSRLQKNDAREQVAVLAVLPRMNAGAAPLLPWVRELASSSDKEVSHQARLTLFQLDAGSRESLYDSLLIEAIAAPEVLVCLRELIFLYRSDPPRQSSLFALLMELPLKRPDADSERINAAVKQLGGDVGLHIAAALKSPHEGVRLQAARTLLFLFTEGWPGETYVSFDQPTWIELIAGLKSDPSLEVRGLADEIGQGPRNYAGGGFGGLGGGFF